MKRSLKSFIALLCVFMMITLVACGQTSDKDVDVPEDTEPVQEKEIEDAEDEQPDEAADEEEGKAVSFEGQTLKAAIFQGGFGDEYWNAVIEKFEERYGVTVEATISPNVGTIIRPQMLAGNVPDFLSLNDAEPSGVVASLIKERGLAELTDIFDGKPLDREGTLRDMIIPGLLESVKYSPYGDGKIYLAPFNSGPMGLVYNKNLFESKGWDVPETWDEFFALGDIAKEEGRALFTYQGIYPGYLESLLFPAIASAAGPEALERIFNYEEGSFNNEEVLKVLDTIARIARDGYLMEGTVALNHTQSQADMMMGKALFITNGTWMENEMADAPREEGFEFALVAPPIFNKGDDRYILASYEQFSIPAHAENIELAKEFIRFLYTDESVKLFGEKAGGVFATKDARELVKPYISESLYNMYGAFDNAITILNNWKTLPVGVAVNPNDVIFENVTAVMNGQMTVEEWAEKVEEAFAVAREALAAEGEQ